MKKIMKTIIAIIVILSAHSANAHQPDISSFTLVEQQVGHWMLQMNASMTAFQYEVRNAYGDDSYATPDEFNQLLLKHMKEQVQLKVNGKELTLKNGLVKLGHATTVAFEIPDFPDEVEEVFVKNTGFENINNSYVVFSIVKNEIDKSSFILSEVNDYKINVVLQNHEVLIAEIPGNSLWRSIVGASIIIGSFIYLVHMSSSKKEFNHSLGDLEELEIKSVSK